MILQSCFFILRFDLQCFCFKGREQTPESPTIGISPRNTQYAKDNANALHSFDSEDSKSPAYKPILHSDMGAVMRLPSDISEIMAGECLCS